MDSFFHFFKVLAETVTSQADGSATSGLKEVWSSLRVFSVTGTLGALGGIAALFRAQDKTDINARNLFAYPLTCGLFALLISMALYEYFYTRPYLVIAISCLAVFGGIKGVEKLNSIWSVLANKFVLQHGERLLNIKLENEKKEVPNDAPKP